MSLLFPLLMQTPHPLTVDGESPLPPSQGLLLSSKRPRLPFADDTPNDARPGGDTMGMDTRP